jgi:fatty acid desaturase
MSEANNSPVPSRDLLNAISKPRFDKWATATASEWIAIVAIYIVAVEIDLITTWCLAVVLIGSRQHALGVLGHDCAHYTAAKNRTLNDLAGELLCFWPLFSGLHDFRKHHFAHHRNFNTDKDPELLFKNQWSRSQWSLPRTRAQILGLFIGDLFGLGAIEIAKAFFLMGRTRPRSIVGPLAMWIVAIAALYHYKLTSIAFAWSVSLLTSFWGFFRLRTWTEHVGSDSTHFVEMNWWQRLFITPHGSWTHAEHHDYPFVPFWQRHRLRSKACNAMPFLRFLDSFSTNNAAGLPGGSERPAASLSTIRNAASHSGGHI